ncbi:hypothetical protein N5C56_02195 [Pseudomonas chengduensis]|nr:hypothetical protein [Pseudomonas chengduensis]MDH1279521.1 hypothetical protein [Pseudomonas chengduensis]MDH1623673.1 hypothetical protein [Pseudomonas chengduensis]
MQMGAVSSLLPENLRSEARSFLRLLDSLLNQLPRACPYCDCTAFKVKQKRHCLCSTCGRSFNSLTGTPLNRLQGRERFRPFVEAWLTGEPAHVVGERLGMDGTTARTWVKRFLLLMEQTHPELYRWWSAYLYRQELELPAHIQERAQRFLGWLARFPFDPSCACPHCGSSELTTQRPGNGLPRWRCKPCGRMHNRLSDTPLKWVGQMELWRPYVELMLRGFTHQDCVLLLGIAESKGTNRDRNWRPRFLKLIGQQDPALLEWVIWQHRRRRGQLASEHQDNMRRRRSVLLQGPTSVCADDRTPDAQ